MATRTAQKRLTREYKAITEDPPEGVIAQPNEDNILEWYYIITGPPDSPYEGGQYMGTLTFPADYPFNPPAIRMSTPSGRFEPGARLCLSISDFHPKTWNPSWSVATIVIGLRSFMTSNEHTAGSIVTQDSKKRQLAEKSKAWNLLCPAFKKHFPELAAQQARELDEAKSAETAKEPTKPAPVAPSPRSPFPTWVFVAGVAVLLALYNVI